MRAPVNQPVSSWTFTAEERRIIQEALALYAGYLVGKKLVKKIKIIYPMLKRLVQA